MWWYVEWARDYVVCILFRFSIFPPRRRRRRILIMVDFGGFPFILWAIFASAPFRFVSTSLPLYFLHSSYRYTGVACALPCILLHMDDRCAHTHVQSKPRGNTSPVLTPPRPSRSVFFRHLLFDMFYWLTTSQWPRTILVRAQSSSSAFIRRLTSTTSSTL